MKPIVAVLGLFVAAAAGALGGYVGSSASGPVATETASTLEHVRGGGTPQAGPESHPAAMLAGAGLAEEMQRLSDQVARLQAEVASYREGATRESAVAAPAGASTELIESGALAILQRDAILKVIDEDRALQAKKVDDERKARESEQAMQRAEKLAKELGMSPAQTRALGEFYALESERRNEMFKDFRNGNMPTDREQARTMFTEYRDWRSTELSTRLGADMATKVTEADGGMDRGFGRMFGGGGGGGGAEAGGGTGERPARQRARNANGAGAPPAIPGAGG